MSPISLEDYDALVQQSSPLVEKDRTRCAIPMAVGVAGTWDPRVAQLALRSHARRP